MCDQWLGIRDLGGQKEDGLYGKSVCMDIVEALYYMDTLGTT